MKLQHQRLVTPCLMAAFFSCKSLQVVETKTSANTPELGIEWNYGDRVDERLVKPIDSVLLKTMDDFNAQSHSFKVHKKERKDKDFVSFEIERAKIVRPGGKVAGYTLSAVGLALPVVMVLAQSPWIFAFVYLPHHEISSRAELSPSLAAEKRWFGLIGNGKLALFTKDRKQVPKMLTNYGNRFAEALKKIEAQLKANAANAANGK
jgi:hypothetical protein